MGGQHCRHEGQFEEGQSGEVKMLKGGCDSAPLWFSAGKQAWVKLPCAQQVSGPVLH